MYLGKATKGTLVELGSLLPFTLFFAFRSDVRLPKPLLFLDF